MTGYVLVFAVAAITTALAAVVSTRLDAPT
jgi:hypothetical protein